MQRVRATLKLWIALIAVVAGPAQLSLAQEAPEAAGSVAAPSAGELAAALPSALEPRVDLAVDELDLLLTPLRREEMIKVSEAWLRLLESKVTELSAVEIAARSAEAAQKEPLLELAGELRGRRTALIDRVEVVLEALEAKGGDATEYRQYVSAVSGVSVQVTDVSGTWITVKNWLMSDTGGIRWAKNLGLFVLTLVIAWIVGRILGAVVRRALLPFKKTSDLLREFLVNMTRRTVIFVGIIVAISVIGVPVAPLLAAIGAAGLVIGLALQDTLGNFASGIMILLYRPYDVGDVINVAGVSGKVISMTLVSTSITTFDNQQIVLPNNSIWGSVITNMTGNDTRRVDMVFGIGYGDDIETARRILEEVVTSHEKVLSDPAPNIKVHELGDSSVNFIVRPWARTADYWDVYWDITRTVKERFDAEGVTIPFPQRDVHMHQAGTA